MGLLLMDMGVVCACMVLLMGMGRVVLGVGMDTMLMLMGFRGMMVVVHRLSMAMMTNDELGMFGTRSQSAMA